jgi:hypothetical protein
MDSQTVATVQRKFDELSESFTEVTKLKRTLNGRSKGADKDLDIRGRILAAFEPFHAELREQALDGVMFVVKHCVGQSSYVPYLMFFAGETAFLPVPLMLQPPANVSRSNNDGTSQQPHDGTTVAPLASLFLLFLLRKQARVGER